MMRKPRMGIDVLAARDYLQNGPLVAFAHRDKLWCLVGHICGNSVNPVIAIPIVLGASQRY